jgi:hypothetical protein
MDGNIFSNQGLIKPPKLFTIKNRVKEALTMP